MLTTQYGVWVRPGAPDRREYRVLRKQAPDGRTVVVYLTEKGGKYAGFLPDGSLYPDWITVTDEEAGG